MTAPWPLEPLGGVIAQCRWICWELEGAKFGHRVVDNPRDPGGRTLSGLTLRTYSRDYLRLPAPALAPIEQFDALTLDHVVDVFVELFAMRTGLWQVGDLALRLAVLDYAIHAGPDDAIAALQRALGVHADGQFGRITLEAVQRVTEPRRVALSVTAARYDKAARRVIEAPQQSVPFLAGWFDRFRRVLLTAASLLALVLVLPAAAQDGGERADGRPRSSLGAVVPHAIGTAVVRPDPALTPGRTRHLALATICSTRWGADRRAVTAAMRRHVLAAYGIAWADRAGFEVDHLVPRSLGGQDSILNLWAQPWVGEWGARKKDRLEVALAKRVCAGAMTLGAAQRAFRTDWVASYHAVFGDDK